MTFKQFSRCIDWQKNSRSIGGVGTMAPCVHGPLLPERNSCARGHNVFHRPTTCHWPCSFLISNDGLFVARYALCGPWLAMTPIDPAMKNEDVVVLVVLVSLTLLVLAAALFVVVIGAANRRHRHRARWPNCTCSATGSCGRPSARGHGTSLERGGARTA